MSLCLFNLVRAVDRSRSAGMVLSPVSRSCERHQTALRAQIASTPAYVTVARELRRLGLGSGSVPPPRFGEGIRGRGLRVAPAGPSPRPPPRSGEGEKDWSST